jgi:hypothetical protein
VLALISIWSDESILKMLATCHKNTDIYGNISAKLETLGFKRDLPLQKYSIEYYIKIFYRIFYRSPIGYSKGFWNLFYRTVYGSSIAHSIEVL